MATQAALGQKALESRDYAEAIKQFTIALKSSQSPLWLIQRSTAYQRSNLYELALIDAENAVLAAQARARRELIATAQFRRAVALHGLGRIGDSRMCFTWVRKLNEKEKGLGMWQAKLAKDYDELPDDAPGKAVTSKETPQKHAEAADGAATAASASAPTLNGAKAPQNPASKLPAGSDAQTPKEKIRNEWFQSNSKITITIFAKNVPKDQAEVEIGVHSLDVRFPTATGSTYDYTVTPLFAKVDVSQSSYSITPNKIEISLHKAAEGTKWPALEGTETEAVATTPDALPIPPSNASGTAAASKVPAYPSSSRKGVKDWDAVATDALKEAKAKDQSSGTEDADARNDVDEEDEGGDAVNSFFQKLYKDADPDTKRAMMKSFVESNGTALSTNWTEVGQKTVETNPPDGVVAKKWDS
ncbi:MAG: hypothetical protein M1818_002419 [Claussenomyces sp. TS43310]|nr:MAG: hypothetical protein M1818_002419 [Claussenomyces sp. TS43310]